MLFSNDIHFKTREELGENMLNRAPSLPTLLFIAVVFSLNIFAIFTVFTVGSSRSDSRPQPMTLPIGEQRHPHPQQRELSWEADGGGGGSREAAPKDSESHSIRLAV